ncbi:MAG: hypothetical protein BWY74_02589 [Firmicutes bacterium ADurb.Bin419]|nr:MAG: hypothetical protein BWY74_02589 [Firmicutes bacterium ADurb.Bin419]
MLKKAMTIVLLVILNIILVVFPMYIAVPGKHSEFIKILIYERYIFIIALIEIIIFSSSFLAFYTKKRILLIICMIFVVTNSLFYFWMTK